MTDDPAVGEAERLHPLFLVTGLGGAIRGVFGAYAVIAYLAFTGRLGTAVIAAIALFAFGVAGVFLYWIRFEFRVGDNEIRIDSGIVNRTHRSIPFDRVQDVDITQKPLARLFGIAQVKFETGASAGEEEGILQAVPLERAHALRELVRARRSGPAVAFDDDGAERPPVYAMDVPRLATAGLFNFSLAVFAALFGLSQTVGDLIGFDPFRRSFWNSLFSASEPIQRFILANQVATAIAGLLSLAFIGVATGMVRTLLRDYGFRLDRTETGLRRRRGLLSLTDVTLPLRRAQAAIIATGPVRDSFGWLEVSLQSLARDQAGSGDHTLAPLATGEEAGTVLEALGWRPLPGDIGWARVSRAFVWVFAIGLVPFALVAIGQAAITPLIGGPALALLAGALASRWLAWRRTAYALDSDRLLIRTGWWRRRTVILPIRRIQSIDLGQSFVSRWFGLANLTFGVAGGTGFSAHSIPALPENSARKLRDQLLVMLT